MFLELRTVPLPVFGDMRHCSFELAVPRFQPRDSLTHMLDEGPEEYHALFFYSRIAVLNPISKLRLSILFW